MQNLLRLPFRNSICGGWAWGIFFAKTRSWAFLSVYAYRTAEYNAAGAAFGRHTGQPFGPQNIDFTEGGHDLEVDWMGKNPMVWIDDALPESDRPYVKFHEIYEHQQMEQGMNYDDAHADASYKEQYYRQHPDELNLADLGFIKSGNLD